PAIRTDGVAPAQAGAHNHRLMLLREAGNQRAKTMTAAAVWVPACAGTTMWRHTSSFSRRDFRLSFAVSLSLSEERAQGKPGADCARSTVCKKGNNAHGFDRYSRDIPTFPAQWLYGLYVLSPVSGVCCHRCPAKIGRQE